jgi:hypothetical protein
MLYIFQLILLYIALQFLRPLGFCPKGFFGESLIGDYMTDYIIMFY